MLRSLWAGVSGMQGHQIALDVESNNIANVNTNGFKYSRAEFSTMIQQNKRSATIPYGGYGGINDYSIGLGTGIETTTKIFSQGSLQNTDRKSDLALSGNGMFVLSNNNGYTRMYSRDGSFGFDAVGNLVNTSGFIVQGWVRDLSQLNCNCGVGDRNIVDSTGPIGNITIDPRLTIPANKTSVVTGNINLTNGNKTEYTVCPSPLDSAGASIRHNAGNQPGGFNALGNNNYIAGGLDRLYDSKDIQHEVPQDMGVMFNDSGEAMRLQQGQGVWISYQTAESKPISIMDENNLPAGTQYPITTTVTINGRDITWTTSNPDTSRSSIILQAQVAINNEKDNTGVEAIVVGGRLVLQNLNQMDGDESKKNIRASGFDNGVFQGLGFTNLDPVTGQPAVANTYEAEERVTTAYLYRYTSQVTADVQNRQFHTTEDIRSLMQSDANMVKQYGGDSAAATQAIGNAAFQDSNFSVSVKLNGTGQFEINNRQDGVVGNDSANAGGYNAPIFNDLNIFVSGFNDTLNTTNVLFKNQMRALNTGVLVEGGNVTTSGGLRQAHYAQTIEIYDSLGNKHEFSMEFTKATGNSWNWRVTVPEPASFVGATAQRPNVLEGGSVTFGSSGELLGFNPSTIQFNPNNGAEYPQNIDMDFGKGGGYDGLTSTGRDSYSTSVGGDGYAAGVLKEYSFNATGTMIGTFDNGVNLALAQVAVATFANYEGLQEAGSNLYAESSNSGQATIGAAGTGGRADIEASKLEMSNSDLSRGLTQLIVVQRGFQASSKSITTSDQVLNTLLGLKQ